MSRISIRSVLAALVALLALGVAVHGDAAKERPGAIADRAQPDPLVGTTSDEDLGKFAPVGMADAIDRVAGTHTAGDAAR